MRELQGPVVRTFERQPNESAKAYRAFALYRDMGPGRCLARTAAVYYGWPQKSRKKAPGTFKRWCREHDWVARAEAYDDFLEMERRSAISDYLREHSTELERRRQQLQEEILTVMKKILPKLKAMADWPLQRAVTEREEVTDDGTRVHREIHVHPARWDFGTLLRAIAILDETPSKVAFTDPAGQQQWGQRSEDIEAEFMALLEEVRREDEEGAG